MKDVASFPISKLIGEKGVDLQGDPLGQRLYFFVDLDLEVPL